MAIIQGSAKSSARGFYPLNIEQSLRFNDDDSAYLSRTPASAGNRKTWTWSGWVKLGNIATNKTLFAARTDVSATYTVVYLTSANDLRIESNTETSYPLYKTNAIFRDPSAWYHFVVSVDMTQATSTNRIKVYVNGELQTTASYNVPAQNTDLNINSTADHYIGRQAGASYVDGYLAEVHFCDGNAYTADDFGELKSGVWVGKTPSVTYGTNGFYLDFANSADIGNDVSGNANDWTPNNFTASDVVLDSPTDNFATLNPISRNGANGAAVFSDGNLVVTRASGDNYQAMATIPVTSGKWYVELTGISATSLRGQFGFLVNDKSSSTVSNRAISQDGYAYRAADGQAYAFGVGTSYGATWTDGDVIGLALDADNGSATFYKNGVSQGVAFSGITADNYLIGTSVEDGGKVSLNFGQQPFTYTPPTGYLALSTANLPDPVIDPAQDASPSDYFNTVLWTGNSGSQTVTSSLEFQPDFLWTKVRNTADSHVLRDIVRDGSTTMVRTLRSNSTIAEYVASGSLTTSANGFSVSGTDGNEFNYTGDSYVTWAWKANGSGVSNTDGSITSTVSVNQKAGFSIVSYDSNPSGTVGHGLGVVPKLIIEKKRDAASDWFVGHTLVDGSYDYLRLNTTAANANAVVAAPTSTVFTPNSSSDSMIAYCFAEVEGYSKFGKYTGNGSADGAFVYCGFRPAFVMIKRTDAVNDWIICDSARNPTNAVNLGLYADLSNAENTNTRYDFLSNGFKLRSTLNESNASGGTYIFMAFAENPFKYSNAR